MKEVAEIGRLIKFFGKLMYVVDVECKKFPITCLFIMRCGENERIFRVKEIDRRRKFQKSLQFDLFLVYFIGFESDHSGIETKSDLTLFLSSAIV